MVHRRSDAAARGTADPRAHCGANGVPLTHLTSTTADAAQALQLSILQAPAARGCSSPCDRACSRIPPSLALRTMSQDRFSRLHLAWTRVRDSLWFAPSVAVVIATVMAVVIVQIPSPASENQLVRLWLFGGGAEGARGMLSAIAGSLITVTGVVFSVTIVALQLASSQFTPRVLGSFVADRVNQVVLGVFIGTFTYTLLVLRTIKSDSLDRTAFVPHIAVTTALVLLLVSIGALIVYINHAAHAIQASVILHRETGRTLARLDVLFPAHVGRAAPVVADAADGAPIPSEASAFVLASASGYLQAVHADPLWALSGRDRPMPVTIGVELHVGTFVFEGKRLASVWPASILDEEVASAVRAAFVLGPERTIEQDVELGLIVIADIALRALSPGINDPTTATQCVDRLTQILATLGTRPHPSVVRQSPDGSVRVHLRATSFARAVSIAFDQIRLYGASNPAIAHRLLDALGDLALIVPNPLHETLRHQVEAIRLEAMRSLADPEALHAIEQHARTASVALDRLEG